MIGRFGRTVRGRTQGGAALLLIAALVAAPEIAAAKTFPVEPGPMPEGDPTADDQPSPAPKKKAARFGSGNSLQIRESVDPTRATRGSRMKWELYLRLLSRLTIR
jgi:hypothetical protein